MRRETGCRGRWRGLALGLLVAAGAGAAHAVVLDDDNRLTLALDDGTQVVLYGEAVISTGGAPPPDPQAAARPAGAAPFAAALSARAVAPHLRAAIYRPAPPTSKYYYLPVGLHLSKRPDGTPEFLFLKFTTEERAEQGGISGALMHFLMEWGLTPQQEEELRAKLRARQPGAQLMGAVPMEAEGETGSFQVISASLSDRALAPSVATSGKAPLVPGGKAAVASRLTAQGAQLLAATFEQSRSITDVSIALNFAFQTLTPAANGTITFDWSKVEQQHDSLRAEYSRQVREGDCFLWWCDEDEVTQTYDEVRQQYKFLEEKQIVKLEFVETVADERVAKIRDAFFEYFLQSMAEPAGSEEPPPPAEGEAPASPDIKQGKSYVYNQESIKSALARKTQQFNLNYRLAVRRPHQLVGNLGSWYEGVRDNPRCVASVNLNDPFFQHRDIHFILDLDAKEMFDEAVNYVTVNVRKNRSAGRPFEDRATIDANFVKQKGINATVTYARGEDTNPDLYEYQAQWSLKGGSVFPPSPGWQKGSWEGVTLAPPVVPRTIEVEGDLAAMQASDITRITVQVHYPRFGAEAEDNIHVSPAQGQSLVAKKIFLDRGARGYAYRLVVNHKTLGKLALPWSAQVGDDYIYAAIPEELLQEGSTLQAQAIEAGREVVNSAKQKVLDQFRELLGGGGQ